MKQNTNVLKKYRPKAIQKSIKKKNNNNSDTEILLAYYCYKRNHKGTNVAASLESGDATWNVM